MLNQQTLSPENRVRRRRRFVPATLLVALLSICPQVAGGTQVSPPPSPHSEPWTSPRLSPRVQHKLTAAHLLAARRIHESGPCRALFEELGADGLEVLGASLYYGATLRQEQRTCPGSSAFTSVGARVTRLCRSFGTLSDRRATVVLIHEALHQAGLSERPLDPSAPDPSGIDRRVSRSCGL